jgi:predicted DCC family thiol-disulfide oxidoreductase YuxK
MKRSDATNIVLYDDECGFCASQTRLLRRLDWFNAFRFQGISDPHSLKLVPSAKREDLSAAIHCVTKDGKVFRAARCFRFIAMRIPALLPLGLLLWLPGAIRVAEKIYNRVARNRQFLSRLFKVSAKKRIF